MGERNMKFFSSKYFKKYDKSKNQAITYTKKSVNIRNDLIKHHFFAVYMHNTTQNAIFVLFEITDGFHLIFIGL